MPRFVDFTLDGRRYRYWPAHQERRYALQLESPDPKVREAAEFLTRELSTEERAVRLERTRSLLPDSELARQVNRVGGAIGAEMHLSIEDEAEYERALAEGRALAAQAA